MAEYGGKQTLDREPQGPQRAASGFSPPNAEHVPFEGGLFQESAPTPGHELDTLRRQHLQMRGRGRGQTLSGLSKAQSVLYAGQTLAGVAPLQARGALHAEGVHAIADQGVSGSAGALPYHDTIQRSFGRFDVSDVRAHTGSEAVQANEALGSHAFARGQDVALKSTDLFTVAHEAAHVVQQRSGVHLKDGIGQEGDSYERHADAVAERVVSGESAEGLLAEVAGAPQSAGKAPVQQRSRIFFRRGGNWSVQFDIGGDGDKDEEVGADKADGFSFEYESGDLNRASEAFLTAYTQERDMLAARMGKACDPVAFMSDANYGNAMMSGRESSRSFFTKVVEELEASRNAAIALGARSKDEMYPEGKRHMDGVAALAEDFAQIYTKIRDDGREMDEKGKLEKGDWDEAAWREQMAGRVLGTIAKARGTLGKMHPEALGPGVTAQVTKSLEELTVFVSVWPKMLKDDLTAVPSKMMWASFAQAIQRYRQILSADTAGRAELKERGGTTAGTKRTRESGDIYGALESFQNDMEDMRIFIDRIAKIETAIRGGNYKSGAEASQALIDACGGTGTDPTFQEALRELGRAVYAESAAASAADGEAEALSAAQKELLAAASALEESKFSLVQSKTLDGKQKEAVQNKNKEELDTLFGLSTDYYARAEENLARYRTLVGDGSKYQENRQLAEELHAQAQAYLRIARAAADSVNLTRWPQLTSNVAKVRNNADGIALKLQDNRALAEAIAQQKAGLDKDADAQEADIAAFAPTKQEIPVNTKKTEADGTEISITSTDFAKGSLTLSGPIPGVPPVLKWFFQLEGQTEMTSGIYNNKDSNDEETMVKVSIGGGLMLDLWFLTVQLKVQGSFEVKVKRSDVGLTEAMMMGAQEMVNWFAARELADVATKRRQLGVAFAKARGTVNGCYDGLASLLVNDYDSFQENASEEFWFSQSKLEQIDDALATLQSDISTTFGDMEADDIGEAAAKFIDRDGIRANVRALANAPREEAGAAVAKAKQGFNDGYDNAVKQVNKSFDDIPGAKNNPEVEFTAAVQVSVGCAVRFTEKVSANVEFAYGQKITDGSGETYQLEALEVYSGKLGLNIDRWAVEAGGELTNGPGQGQELKTTLGGKGTIKDFFDPEPPATVQNFGQYMKMLRALNPNPASIASELGNMAQTFRRGIADSVEAHKDPQKSNARAVKFLIEFEGKWVRPDRRTSLTLTEFKVSIGTLMDGSTSKIAGAEAKKPGLGLQVDYELGKKINATFKFPPPAAAP